MLTVSSRGIYGRKYPPSLIPVNDLTYVYVSLKLIAKR